MLITVLVSRAVRLRMDACCFFYRAYDVQAVHGVLTLDGRFGQSVPMVPNLPWLTEQLEVGRADRNFSMECKSASWVRSAFSARCISPGIWR